MMFMKELVVELFKMSSWSPRRARGGPQFNVIALTTLGLAPWLVEWRWTTES